MFNPRDMTKRCTAPDCTGQLELWGPEGIIPDKVNFTWRCTKCEHNENPTFYEIREINRIHEITFSSIGYYAHGG